MNLSTGKMPVLRFWEKRIERRKWVRDTYGKDMLLGAQYGIPPTELCRIMNLCKDRAERTTNGRSI
jgi:hypothetical protein